MQKYALLRERLVTAGIAGPANLRVPLAASVHALCRVHDAAYVQAVSNGTLDASTTRRIGFPWSYQLVERSFRSVGATVAAARDALGDGFSASLAGGTHHAFDDRILSALSDGLGTALSGGCELATFIPWPKRSTAAE